MILKFEKISFINAENFESIYQSSFYCLGIIVDINKYERFILGSTRFFSENEEDDLGVFSLSIPASVDALDVFQNVSAMGGNVLSTPIVAIDQIPMGDHSSRLPLKEGEIELNMPLSHFEARLRTDQFVANLTITPAGFFRLLPQKNPETHD